MDSFSAIINESGKVSNEKGLPACFRVVFYASWYHRFILACFTGGPFSFYRGSHPGAGSSFFPQNNRGSEKTTPAYLRPGKKFTKSRAGFFQEKKSPRRYPSIILLEENKWGNI